MTPVCKQYILISARVSTSMLKNAHSMLTFETLCRNTRGYLEAQLFLEWQLVLHQIGKLRSVRAVCMRFGRLELQGPTYLSISWG